MPSEDAILALEAAQFVARERGGICNQKQISQLLAINDHEGNQMFVDVPALICQDFSTDKLLFDAYI